MHDLLTHLPVVGTCGVVALLAGPLALLPINLGAWLLEWLCYPTRAGDPRRAALHDSVRGRKPVSVNFSWEKRTDTNSASILLEKRTDTNSA